MSVSATEEVLSKFYANPLTLQPLHILQMDTCIQKCQQATMWQMSLQSAHVQHTLPRIFGCNKINLTSVRRTLESKEPELSIRWRVGNNPHGSYFLSSLPVRLGLFVIILPTMCVCVSLYSNTYIFLTERTLKCFLCCSYKKGKKVSKTSYSLVWLAFW